MYAFVWDTLYKWWKLKRIDLLLFSPIYNFQAHDGELKAALNTALEIGYRHIDTASAYRNEKEIGDVLSEWFSAGKLKREDVFITTKLPSTALQPELVVSTLKKSLDLLQLDYVDLYLIHSPVYRKIDEASGKFVAVESDYIGVWKVQ